MIFNGTASYLNFHWSPLKRYYSLSCRPLYYKHVTIINDNSSIISKWSFKLIDDPRVIIYDCHRFILQAAGVLKHKCNIYSEQEKCHFKNFRKLKTPNILENVIVCVYKFFPVNLFSSALCRLLNTTCKSMLFHCPCLVYICFCLFLSLSLSHSLNLSISISLVFAIKL